MKKIFLEGIEFDDFMNEIKALLHSEFKESIDALQAANYSQKIELLTRKEVAAMLKISLPTLNDWVKKGSIPAYRIEGNIRFKKVEVLECFTKIKSYGNGRLC